MTLPSKFETCRPEAKPATSRSRRLIKLLDLYEWVGKKHFVSLKKVRAGDGPAILTYQASSFNYCSRAPPRPRGESVAYSTSGQELRQCVTDWCEVKVKIMTSASQLSLYIMRGNDTRGGDRMIWYKSTSGHHIILHGVNSFSAGTVFRRQNLTSTDVRFWRIKTIPVLKELKYV